MKIKLIKQENQQVTQWWVNNKHKHEIVNKEMVMKQNQNYDNDKNDGNGRNNTYTDYGADEQKQRYNQVVRHGINTSTIYTQNENLNNNANNIYRYGYENVTKFGEVHAQACLLFIGGIPLSMHDPTRILVEIEKEYKVKFVNQKSISIKTKNIPNPKWGFIAPIAVETPEMARKLIGIYTLNIPNYNTSLRITCRKYRNNGNLHQQNRSYINYGNNYRNDWMSNSNVDSYDINNNCGYR